MSYNDKLKRTIVNCYFFEDTLFVAQLPNYQMNEKNQPRLKRRKLVINFILCLALNS